MQGCVLGGRDTRFNDFWRAIVSRKMYPLASEACLVQNYRNLNPCPEALGLRMAPIRHRFITHNIIRG